jgi:hypothetical protein
MARYQRPVLNLDADTVWSAACAAQRINGEYVKMVTSYTTNDEILTNSLVQAVIAEAKQTNRQIIDKLLADTSQITDADRVQAEAVRKYYKAFTFKILQGKMLSEFDNNAMVISNRDVIESNYDVAVIASLPASYERAVKRDSLTRKIESASGGFVGRVGDKVKLTVEVVRSVFSQQWNVFFITGITTDDQPVFFSYRETIPTGKTIVAQGTVKAHRDNSTQLNRVKLV